MNKIEVSFEGTEPERLHAIEASAANLLAKVNSPSQKDCVWNLAEAVWPALTMPEYRGKPVENVVLRLVPLTRIGQMEGKSGSLVLIGFLADGDDLERPHSHPVVIKTLATEQRDKLQEEYDNGLSIRPFAYDQKDNLAIPIFFDAQEDFNVLWSIFSPSDPIWPLGVSETSGLKVRDLRAPLEAGKNEAAQPILDTTFRLLRNLHH